MKHEAKSTRKLNKRARVSRKNRFVHLTALLLCLLMLFSGISPDAYAVQGEELSDGADNTVSAITNEDEANEPECTCGSEEVDINNHADDCARKIWNNQETEEQACSNVDGENGSVNTETGNVNTETEELDLNEVDYTCENEEADVSATADDSAEKNRNNQKVEEQVSSDADSENGNANTEAGNVNTETGGLDLNEADCTCGNEEADVSDHADDCARKIWWSQLAEEQDASTLASLWELFPEDAQEYILTYLSWTNLDKYKELEKLVNGSEEPPVPITIGSVGISVASEVDDSLNGLSLSAVNGKTERAKKDYFENQIIELDDEEREEGSFTSFDLSLLNEEGESIQPESAVPLCMDLGAEPEDEVEVYHLLDDAAAITEALNTGKEIGCYTESGLSAVFAKECAAAAEATGEVDTIYYEILATWNDGLTNNGDGTVSFDATSFSYYWTWNSGNRKFSREFYSGGNNRILIDAKDKKTLYIPYSEQDQVVKFRSLILPNGDGYSIISGTQYATLTVPSTANGDVTIKGGTPEDSEIKVKYTHIDPHFSDTVILKVVRVPKEFIKDATDIPVSIAIMNDSSFIKSEPSKTSDGIYCRVESTLRMNSNTSTIYSNNAYDLIDKEILDNSGFIQNANGDYVWGLVDATGRSTMAELKLDQTQQDTIVKNYLRYIEDTTKNPADYRLLPYVIKVEMVKGSTSPTKHNNAAWFIDCVVVRKDQYTVSYQTGLDYGYEIKSGALPDGTVVNEGDEVTVGSTDIKAQKESDDGKSTYTATFKGWRDQYGNTYQPGDKITSIQKDYILYAVWDYPDQNLGNLRLGKTVVKGTQDSEPNAAQEFTFKVSLNGQSGTYNYAVINTTGHAVSRSTISNGGTISFTAEQYVIIYDLPKDTSYTVTEIDVPNGYQAKVGEQTGRISAGNTAFANFTNEWIGKTADLKITKTIPADTTGDRTKYFTFTVKNESLAGRTIGGKSFDEDGKATFQLKHGETQTLKDLPVGKEYLITETNAEGYTVSYKIGSNASQNGNVATVTLGENGETVEFINSQNLTPPTGLDSGNTGRIYGLIPAAMFMLTTGLFIRISYRSKKRRDIQG